MIEPRTRNCAAINEDVEVKLKRVLTELDMSDEDHAGYQIDWKG
jgi:hypothetical protein